MMEETEHHKEQRVRVQALQDEAKRLKALAREMDKQPKEGRQNMPLTCKRCYAEIPEHFGEVTLTIQPHVIEDGSFWKIDDYQPDIVKKDIVCEDCIILLKNTMRKVESPLPEVSWSDIWYLIKDKVHRSIRKTP